MENIGKNNKNNQPDEDLGFLLWQLEEIENFYPCYKKMINEE